MATHSSILAWRIPWVEKLVGCVHGDTDIRVTHSQTQLSDSPFTQSYKHKSKNDQSSSEENFTSLLKAFFVLPVTILLIKIRPKIFLQRRQYLLSVQFSSVVQSCPTLHDPMNHSTPGLPVHHQLPEFTQTHVHRVSDVIQPSHPLSSPSPPAPNPSQHQSLFQ